MYTSYWSYFWSAGVDYLRLRYFLWGNLFRNTNINHKNSPPDAEYAEVLYVKPEHLYPVQYIWKVLYIVLHASFYITKEPPLLNENLGLLRLGLDMRLDFHICLYFVQKIRLVVYWIYFILFFYIQYIH